MFWDYIANYYYFIILKEIKEIKEKPSGLS